MHLEGVSLKTQINNCLENLSTFFLMKKNQTIWNRENNFNHSFGRFKNILKSYSIKWEPCGYTNEHRRNAWFFNIIILKLTICLLRKTR